MNLYIEGTKHEKAVLVILSYVSGFTAGFIVFGIAQFSTLQADTVVSDPMMIENMIEEVSTPVATQPENYEIIEPLVEESVDTSLPVLYTEGRLRVNVNGASVLLSAQRNTVDAETAKTFANQGVHQAIPNFITSEDGSYIYFCEQHSVEDLCTNFIYNVETGMIQYVTIDGVKAITPAAIAKAVYFEGNTLHLATAMNASPTTPWKLVSAQ
jgi:hypothetical protein